MKPRLYQNALFLLIFVGLGPISFALNQHATTGLLEHAVPKVGIDFIEDKRQWDCEARFKADIPGGVLFLTSKGFVYNFMEPYDLHDHHEGEIDVEPAAKLFKGHTYKVNFVSGNPASVMTPNQKRSYYHNYFLNNDTSCWAGKVGLFGQVRYQNVYPGTDVVLYSNSENFVKYDFIVAAGEDSGQIALSFEGINPELDPKGNLRIRTSVNEIVEEVPYTYQLIDSRKVEIKSRYKMNKGALSFEFPEGYDKAYDLAIEPTLVFASFSGTIGNFSFYAHSTTFDGLGSTYSAVLASGPGWPTTMGAYEGSSFSNNENIAISKINTRGTALVYATYFGGIQIDRQLLNRKFYISLQNTRLQQQNFWFVSLSLCCLLLLSAFIGFIFICRKKQRLQQDAIAPLKANISDVQECNRIVTELHNSIANQLWALRLNLDHLLKDTEAYDQQRQSFQFICDQLNEMTQEIWGTVHNLMPGQLLNGGFSKAIVMLCERTGQSTRLDVEFLEYGTNLSLNIEIQVSLYRIIQELMQNVLKHANATKLLVQLSCVNTLLNITIEDNGSGLAKLNSRNKFGLKNIQRRVEILQGQFDLKSEPGVGTSIYMEFDILCFPEIHTMEEHLSFFIY